MVSEGPFTWKPPSCLMKLIPRRFCVIFPGSATTAGTSLTTMPSILIETGFLTHRADARRLRDPAYLELLAGQITRGLVRYRGTAGPVLARSER